ncbi:MAG: UDP-N-acetylglucosamine 1-carboxyvinyltransferase [Cyanobacteriota bacterium]|nr:UDP-N-acetylglucosamine 1-carboxyvinyltransferase [Cyanobacteriota bacterium]
MADTLPEQPEPVLQIWGRHPLKGHASISGSKNSALALMAGTLLSSDPCRIHNVPRLMDIQRMGEILQALGVEVSHQGHTLDINPRHLRSAQAPYELVSQLRASFFITGPLLARLGVARVPLPGGCAIGSRPVDLHVRGLQALGATVQIDHGVVHAYARKLTGSRIYLDYPSVGATETLMMAAVVAEGETIIENAAQEPEVADLARLCQAMGAKIRGVGTNTLMIVGVPRLHGTEYTVIPDRVEASTFLIAGAITRSTITIGPVIPDHLRAVIAKLQAMGLEISEVAPNRLQIAPNPTESGWICRATDIETLPYPGFPTDVQAPMMALAALAEGDCILEETVFENRMHHVPELNRMGADIRLKNGVAIIRGVPMLSGAPVMATDLRAGAALVLAGLAAEGLTTIRGLQHLDRGYESIDRKLQELGSPIRRALSTDPSPPRPGSSPSLSGEGVASSRLVGS